MKKHFHIIIVIVMVFLIQFPSLSQNNGYRLNGFQNSPYFNEQILSFNYNPKIKVHINAPSPKSFDPNKKVIIALYALPNGNTTEQTIGKVLNDGVDWHFDIQHIGAQTRFIRNKSNDFNWVTVYLENELLSWPAWKAEFSSHDVIISNLVDHIRLIFKDFSNEVILTGHSGGGRFNFSFIDHFDSIPSFVKRIVFLDSNYGYEDSYGAKFVNWLNSSEDNVLFTIAYNDSVAIYNGQPIVSATGGTWYRSRIMQKYLSNYFTFETVEDEEFINHKALNGRIKILLKKNPEKIILHTVQVELNGFIHAVLNNSELENSGYEYYKERAYTDFIQNNIEAPRALNIPDRPVNAQSGSSFMSSVESMTFAQREDKIFQEISSGNIPSFLRTLTKLESEFNDAAGNSHIISYEVMPDYLAIGSDQDYCRVPMGPKTAQRIADLFGAILPTSKLVDEIYSQSDIKLEPVTYFPVGNMNELVSKFVEHNKDIELQLTNANARLTQLIAGTKKDVVISNKILDHARPDHVVIYGWHKLDGTPIQPVTNIHVDTYTDYSHGIRLLNSEVLLDGELINVVDLLRDNNLHKIFNSETEPIIQPSYFKVFGTPQKPVSFGAISEDGNKLRIVIKEAEGVEYYKVYLGIDGITFGSFKVLQPDNLLINNLFNNRLIFIKIQAGNSIGESPFSEVLGIGIPEQATSPSLLIVNGFDRPSEGNTNNFIRLHGKAFFENLLYFNSATNEAITDGLFNLSDYKNVDYILGEESTVDETFTEVEQSNVIDFLQAGGNLFVSGSELAWDLDNKGSGNDKYFINNYLKVKYNADSPHNIKNGSYVVSNLSDELFPNITSLKFDDGTHGTYNVDWPDVFGTINGGKGMFSYSELDTSNGFAGVYYEGLFPGGISEGKVLVLGFPFETVYNEPSRMDLAKGIVNFFDTPTDVRHTEIENGLDKFTLFQNYPNPFNAATNISYYIPKSGRVGLFLYDLNGSRISVLEDTEKSEGNHNYFLDAKSLASGIYFYTLVFGSKALTKSILLVK